MWSTIVTAVVVAVYLQHSAVTIVLHTLLLCLLYEMHRQLILDNLSIHYTHYLLRCRSFQGPLTLRGRSFRFYQNFLPSRAHTKWLFKQVFSVYLQRLGSHRCTLSISMMNSSILNHFSPYIQHIDIPQ